MPSQKAVRSDVNPDCLGVDVHRDDLLTHSDGNNFFDTEYNTEPEQHRSCGRQPVGSSCRR